MDNNKHRRVPPAKGLRILTWVQVETLDQHIAQVCEAKRGEVVITVERCS